ncbi:hypothetical protein BDQ17DRAFT_1351295 [Cyathus striatus]|nr:hypothetical protein BDQ17DRAFT_1351295 [Cyathus striatus]
MNVFFLVYGVVGVERKIGLYVILGWVADCAMGMPGSVCMTACSRGCRCGVQCWIQSSNFVNHCCEAPWTCCCTWSKSATFHSRWCFFVA